jgi:hypothetical protein
MRRPILLTFLLLALLSLVACGDEPSPSPQTWKEIPAKELGEAARAKKLRASRARDALFGRLSSRLGQALEEGSPAEAIGVCREAAPRIAGEVAGAQGVRIGRTSFRLRNPANRPPDWARPYVEARRDTDLYLVGSGGGLRALLPIGMQPLCLTCHGPSGEWPEDLRAAVQEHYPDDKAVGFPPRSLRGWFWIEVP